MKSGFGIRFSWQLDSSDNFVIMYELFDEMMDFGFPQVFSVSHFSHPDHRHAGDERVHHAGVPASGEDHRGAVESHERRELAPRRHQIQEERRVPGRDREGESPGGPRWDSAGQRDRGNDRNEGVFVWNARVEAG